MLYDCQVSPENDYDLTVGVTIALWAIPQHGLTRWGRRELHQSHSTIYIYLCTHTWCALVHDIVHKGQYLVWGSRVLVHFPACHVDMRCQHDILPPERWSCPHDLYLRPLDHLSVSPRACRSLIGRQYSVLRKIARDHYRLNKHNDTTFYNYSYSFIAQRVINRRIG